MPLIVLGGCNLFGESSDSGKSPEQVLQSMQSKLYSWEMNKGNVTGSFSVDMKTVEGDAKLSATFNEDFDMTDPENAKAKAHLEMGGAGDVEGTKGEFGLKADMVMLGKKMYFNVEEIDLTSAEEPNMSEMVKAFITPYLKQWWMIDLPEEVVMSFDFEKSLTQELDLTEEQVQKLKELVENANLFTVVEDMGMEEINGTKTHHYSVKLDSDGLVTFMKEAAVIAGEPGPTPEEEQEVREALKDLDLSGQFWIGTKDMYPYKVDLKLNLKDIEEVESGTVTVLLTIDPNAKVDVQAPEQAKDLMEMLVEHLAVLLAGDLVEVYLNQYQERFRPLQKFQQLLRYRIEEIQKRLSRRAGSFFLETFSLGPYTTYYPAVVVELVDTRDSKSRGRKAVRVRFSPTAPLFSITYICTKFLSLHW